jgi:hypothetical protein
VTAKEGKETVLGGRATYERGIGVDRAERVDRSIGEPEQVGRRGEKQYRIKGGKESERREKWQRRSEAVE